MKVVDDYQAKYRLWASNPVVVPLPQGPVLPRFRSQKFRSHEEMNRWKEALLHQMARSTTGRDEH